MPIQNPQTFQHIISAINPDATYRSATPLTGGVSADVYRLDFSLPNSHTESVVLRIHGDTHSGHPADTEFALLKWLFESGVPVPKPLVLDTSGSIVAEHWLAMSFVAGTSDIPTERLDQSIEMMAEALARVHGLALDGVPRLPSRLDPLPELFDFLPNVDELKGLREHLAGLADTAYAGESVLLHGDYWPANLLWSEAGALAAILDWEDSASGDPMCDVAQARVELRHWFGEASMEAFTQAYAKHADLDRERVSLWQVYVACAAHHYVADWGLPAETEAQVKRSALSSIRDGWKELNAQ